jgi:hypothetical protein
MSGFGALDVAVGTPGSALELFALRWHAFRWGSTPVETDPMAAAILAGDVPGLGDLIAGADAAKIRIDRNKLPLELSRRPKRRATLLDVAASIGGAPLRYLLEFFGLKPTIETLHQAVATGESDLIRTVWDRLSPDVRAAHVEELTMTAADFHHVDVANWLLIDARPGAVRNVRRFANEHRLFDILLRLPDVAPTRGIFAVGSFADECGEELVEWLQVKPEVAELLLAKSAGPWDFGEFKAKVVGKAPLLVLVDFAGGVCGGFAAVPFPDRMDKFVADSTGASFVFSLRPTVARFPLQDKAKAVHLAPEWGGSFRFGICCLAIFSDGRMFRLENAYAVPSAWETRDWVKITRFEVWRVTS